MEELARTFAGYSAAGQKLLAERLAASRELLERADDDRYALELFITENTDPVRMERFLLRAREIVPLDALFVIPVTVGEEYRVNLGLQVPGARPVPVLVAALGEQMLRPAGHLAGSTIL